MLLIVALLSFLFPQQPGVAAGNGTVISPCQTKSSRGCTVANTSPCDSNKKAKIQDVGATSVHVSGDNGVSMDVTGLEAGDDVLLPANSTSTVVGSGTVVVGNHCTATLSCPAGSTAPLVFTYVTGGGGMLQPGNTVTVTS